MQERTHSDERTDIRRIDQHYSWKGVYALCGVESNTHSDATPPEDEPTTQVIP
jgi:hypothetical protein